MPALLAIFAHPDDIEFKAAGTMLLLKERGWNLHYWNLSSGNLGSTEMSPIKTARTRRGEARNSARLMGARWYAPIGNDLQLFYEDRMIRRICAVIRQVKPSIILTHPPIDYMEDHTETCRLVVTAAFARNIPNYRSIPHRPSIEEPLALYHSSPHGLVGPTGEPFQPTHWVNVEAMQERKLQLLACHQSQKEWLDRTQGMDSYLAAMQKADAQLGEASGRFTSAEAWVKHLHLGFGPEQYDPLSESLGVEVHQPAVKGRRTR